MASFKIKNKVGRPRASVKIRDLRAITPKNYIFVKAKGNLAYFKRVGE